VIRRPAILAALALAAAAMAACGAGKEPSRTTLTVTDGFGAVPLRDLRNPQVRGSETVMRLLQRNAQVTTRYGGGFVQSIDGRGGGHQDGRPVDWFFYVNGVEASEGATATRLRSGDRVWWDRHDWSAAMRVPAVVGSFPEPFVHGVEGKRLPVRVECAPGSDRACRSIQRRLAGHGVAAALAGRRSIPTVDSLRVAVGPWRLIAGDPDVKRLEQGPRQSGVYARPAPGGRRIALLDGRGRTTRTLGAGGGLVAATRAGDDAPLWMVTGTDDAGVAAAARAFDEGTLGRHFALAVADDVGVPLPTRPRAAASR
jgi:hypothetical protein